MASATKRISKELAEVTNSPTAGIKVTVDEADIHNWKIVLDGPLNSPYAGGHFNLHLRLPPDYPFKPPTLTFKTKIYHPNVTNDDKGSMCIGMLKGDNWKPSSKIVAILEAARQLLQEPNIEDSVEAAIANEFKDNRREFERKAKEFTKKYAA